MSASAKPRPLAALTAYLVRSQVKPALIWGVSLGLLSLWIVLFYPTVAENEFMQQYFDSFPEAMRAFFDPGGGDLSTIQGFLGVEMFSLILPVSLPFYAVVIASRSIAGAEQQGRLDLLLSTPVRRRQLVIATFVEMAAGLSLILAVTAVMTWVPAKLIGSDLTIGQTLSGLGALLPFSLFFGALALVVSSFVRHAGTSTSIAGATLIVMYFVSGFAKLVDSIRFMQRSTLFHHYRNALIGGIDWKVFAATTAISLAMMAAAIVLFSRRDIHS